MMSRSWFAGSILLWVVLATNACNSDVAVSITLRRVAPAADPLCGAPDDAQTLVVTALGDFSAAQGRAASHSIGPSGTVDITAFPAATRVLAVQVLGGSGVLRAIGKTMPFDLDALASGDELTVFMAPPRGLCPTGPPGFARARPLVARTGPGALIAGGIGDDGAPVIAMEQYDAATGAFEVVGEEHYGTGEHGLVGASMTALPGRDQVVIAGGGVPAYQVYDSATGALSAALFLSPGRAFHAALALDDHQVLVAGGCSPLAVDHQCMPASALLSTSIIDVRASEVRPGPALMVPRIGGAIVRESDGTALLIGGVDDTGAAVGMIERIRLYGDPSDMTSELIPGDAGVAAKLAAGGALMAFAAPAGQGGNQAAVLPPGATAVVDATDAPWPLVGATMTALEDGLVLVAGAQAGGAARMLLYQPNRAGFQALATAAGPGPDHGAVRLGDGTVLMVGGRDSDAPAAPPRALAWIVRPDLTGPFAGDMAISFGDVALSRNLVPRDPAMTALVPMSDAAPPHYVLTSSGTGGALPSEWAVIAGPVFTHANVIARVRTLGGVALLSGFADADSYTVTVLIPGQAATAYRVEQGRPRVIEPCAGEIIAADELAPAGDESADIELVFGPDSLQARIAERDVLHCTGVEPMPAGLAGLGVVGESGTALRVDYLSVSR